MALKTRTVKDLWLFLLFASIFDIIFTQKLLKYDGVTEANGLIRSSMTMGLGSLIFSKFFPLIVLGLIIVLNNAKTYYRCKILDWGIIICVAAISIVLAIHLYFYFSLLGAAGF